MHNCPHCHQELSAFAFYCPRCSKPVGELAVEADMLSIWWLNVDLLPHVKCGVKTLKHGTEYLNLSSVSPSRPASGKTEILFTARTPAGDETIIPVSAVEVFTEAMNSSQEWKIQ